MARENPTWGQGRIALELAIKMGLLVSPRTVAKYMPRDPDRRPGRVLSNRAWATFIRNHTREIVARDFTTVMTAGLRSFYLFVLMELGSRKILHWNVTRNPTADWTTQQLREAIPAERTYRFLLHRDSILSANLDRQARGMGVRILKSPRHSPQANAFCDRLIGTLKRECLRLMIVWNERHLRSVLRDPAHACGHRFVPLLRPPGATPLRPTLRSRPGCAYDPVGFSSTLDKAGQQRVEGTL